MKVDYFMDSVSKYYAIGSALVLGTFVVLSYFMLSYR